MLVKIPPKCFFSFLARSTNGIGKKTVSDNLSKILIPKSHRNISVRYLILSDRLNSILAVAGRIKGGENVGQLSASFRSLIIAPTLLITAIGCPQGRY